MKTAEEFFKERYGHSYNTQFDTIEIIKFATQYASQSNAPSGGEVRGLSFKDQVSNLLYDLQDVPAEERYEVVLEFYNKLPDTRPVVTEEEIKEVIDRFHQPLDITGLDADQIDAMEQEYDKFAESFSKAILELLNQKR